MAQDRDDEHTVLMALLVARERVTGDDLQEKQKRRDRLKLAISGVYAVIDGDQSGRPSAAELREMLGDPDDKDIRLALDRWDVQP